MRIAIPVSQGKLAQHFGHCECFELIDVDPKDNLVMGREMVTPPPHEPGVLPAWLADKGATVILAGGMGSRAVQLFNANNIKVVVGVPDLDPLTLVQTYVAGDLSTGTNVCDH